MTTFQCLWYVISWGLVNSGADDLGSTRFDLSALLAVCYSVLHHIVEICILRLELKFRPILKIRYLVC